MRNSIDEAIEATVCKYTTDEFRPPGGATGDGPRRPTVAFEAMPRPRQKSESKNEAEESGETTNNKKSAEPSQASEEKQQKSHRGSGRPRKISESDKASKKTNNSDVPGKKGESTISAKDSAASRRPESSAVKDNEAENPSSSKKAGVEMATETENNNNTTTTRPQTSHSEMAIQTDSEIQADVDPALNASKPPVKKTMTLDIGVQVDPAEMMADQERPTDKVLCSSSVAIQVTEPVPAMQPLEIQVDMDDMEHANVGTSPRRPLQSPRKTHSPRGLSRQSPRSPQRASPRLSPHKAALNDSTSEDYPIISPMKGSEASSPLLHSSKPEGAAVEKSPTRSPGRPKSLRSPKKLKAIVPALELNESVDMVDNNASDDPVVEEAEEDAAEGQEKPRTVRVALPKKMLTPRFEEEFERFVGAVYDTKGAVKGPRTSSPRGARPVTDLSLETDVSNNSEPSGNDSQGTEGDHTEGLDKSSDSDKLNKSSSEPEVCVIDDSDRDGDNVIVIDEDEEDGCEACSELQKKSPVRHPKRRGPGRPPRPLKRSPGRPPKRGKHPQKSHKDHTCREGGGKSDSESVVIVEKAAEPLPSFTATEGHARHKVNEDKSSHKSGSTTNNNPTPSPSQDTIRDIPRPFPGAFASQEEADSVLDTSNSVLDDSMDITNTTQSGFSSQLSQSSQQSDIDPSDVDWTPQLEGSKFARSEYEPLPLVKKKRKRYGEDMGYSKPKKRRRKKKHSQATWQLSGEMER